jgi:hypothetical protein
MWKSGQPGWTVARETRGRAGGEGTHAVVLVLAEAGGKKSQHWQDQLKQITHSGSPVDKNIPTELVARRRWKDRQAALERVGAGSGLGREVSSLRLEDDATGCSSGGGDGGGGRISIADDMGLRFLEIEELVMVVDG